MSTTRVSTSNLVTQFPILSLNKLAWTLNVRATTLKKVAEEAGRYYKPFDIRQIKKGSKVKLRHIDNPRGELKNIQNRINKRLLREVMLSMPKGMIGGVAGKSILDNAMYHVSQEVVVTIDLKNCFPNTDHTRIFKVWRNYLGNGDEVSRILTQLTTFQTRLPQGAPTSLPLCNLALLPLYKNIRKYSREHGLNLTLYVDDIAISGEAGVPQKSIERIIKIIQKEGYSVRRSKIKIMPLSKQQKVTGIVVNKKASIALEKRQGIRQEILNLAKRENPTRRDLQVIWGKINHVSRVSALQGNKLADFAKLMLPAEGRETYKEPETEIVKCSCTKKHEEHKNNH